MSYGPNYTDLFRRPPTMSTNSARIKGGRSTDPAADQVRAGHQSHDRQGARPHRSPSRFYVHADEVIE